MLMFSIKQVKLLKVFWHKIPPQKDDNIVNLDKIDLDSYELLEAGGVKLWSY